MRENVSLGQMLDLALGTPEVGAVNHNILHSFLHAILLKLNLKECKIEVSQEDLVDLHTKQSENASDSLETKSVADSGIGVSEKKSDNGSKPIILNKFPYHQLEARLANVEDQLEKLNTLPSHVDLLNQIRLQGGGEKVSRPVIDMWQAMEFSKRVDLNKEGVEKLMGMMNDMMGEHLKLKKEVDELKKQLSETNGISEDEMKNELKRLEGLIQLLSDNQNDFVTWQGLEDALKGIRLEMEPKERIVIEAANQTEPSDLPPRPESSPPSRPLSSKRSDISTPGPSAELTDLLEKLGHLSNRHDHLTDRHDQLCTRVDNIEDQLNTKANKEDVQGLGNQTINIPDDFLDQFKALEKELEGLRKAKHEVNYLQKELARLEEIRRNVHLTQKKQADIEAKIAELKASIQLAQRLKSETKLASLASVAAVQEKMLKNTEEKTETNILILSDREPNAKEIQRKLGANSQITDIGTSEAGVFPPIPLQEIPKTTEQQIMMMQPLPDDFLDQVEKINKLEMNLLEKTEQLLEIDERIQQIVADSKKQMNGLKTKILILEQELANLKAEKSKLALQRIMSNTGTEEDALDNEALNLMQKLLNNLQRELERVNESCNKLLSDSEMKQTAIDRLFTDTTKLDDLKADKDYVVSEVDMKADKRLVDSKVSRSVFNTTTDDLNSRIADLLNKLNQDDDEWKRLLNQLSGDLDGKLDRLEFGPIRQELERQLRALAHQLKNMDFLRDNAEDEAAGLRKQLVQKFHCISCDRPVEMTPQGAIPSIPAVQGLPSTQSNRPYTTYELEQIRQNAKRTHWTKGSDEHSRLKAAVLGRKKLNRAIFDRQYTRVRLHGRRPLCYRFIPHLRPLLRQSPDQVSQSIDIMDLYSTNRSCGGSHTTTFPHRRITRTAGMNNLIHDDGSPVPPTYRKELDIVGADGHVYKGRLDSQHLPELPKTAPGLLNSNGSTPGQVQRDLTPRRPMSPGQQPINQSRRPLSATSPSPNKAPPASLRDETESQAGFPHQTTTPIPPQQ